MREIDYIILEDLEALLDDMLEVAEEETKKRRMPKECKIHISNAKYGHHGNGKDEKL